MQRFIAGIRQFHDDRNGTEEFISSELVAAQRPEILLVTCSDSRVVPHIVSHSDPGRIFVIRNAGNVLPAAGVGSSEEGTIEYGVAALGIRHLVVCGHTHCGAMAALYDPDLARRHPAVARWLENAENVRTSVDQPGNGRAAQANVLLQLERARTYPVVHAAVEAGALELHGWVYDIRTARFSRFDSHARRFVDLLGPENATWRARVGR